MFGRKKVVKSILLVFILLGASLFVPAISGKQVKNSVQKFERQLSFSEEIEDLLTRDFSEHDEVFLKEASEIIEGGKINLTYLQNLDSVRVNFSLLQLFRLLICSILFLPTGIMALSSYLFILIFLKDMEVEQLKKSILARLCWSSIRRYWVVITMIVANFDITFYEAWQHALYVWPPADEWVN